MKTIAQSFRNNIIKAGGEKTSPFSYRIRFDDICKDDTWACEIDFQCGERTVLAYNVRCHDCHHRAASIFTYSFLDERRIINGLECSDNKETCFAHFYGSAETFIINKWTYCPGCLQRHYEDSQQMARRYLCALHIGLPRELAGCIIELAAHL
jgi:hypothetical protein